MSAPRATVPVPSTGLQRVALGPEMAERGSPGPGLAAAPGCAESVPLFRSHMPRLVGWRPVQMPPEAGNEAEEVPPAMHQALHLCVVESFQPQRPFGGASKALYRI